MKATQRQLSSSFTKFSEQMSLDMSGTEKNRDLQSIFKTLGEKLSDEEAEAAVKLSDLDGDGMLDFDEFTQLIKGDYEFTEEEKQSKIMEAFRMLMKLGESRTTDDGLLMIKAFDF
ncbi:unnamed protein product [Eruca vesicaria subsp. sativa]|uniref:EF-hand domain-containing protein n=1 Tax=Eruca vesicaria subsp. sativa TaxID=29727 RepID=A0ABC8KDM2_ERUVS|nr:unnamed protein product [Eruca vesicaria subsp. sativa]